MYSGVTADLDSKQNILKAVCPYDGGRCRREFIYGCLHGLLQFSGLFPILQRGTLNISSLLHEVIKLSPKSSRHPLKPFWNTRYYAWPGERPRTFYFFFKCHWIKQGLLSFCKGPTMSLWCYFIIPFQLTRVCCKSARVRDVLTNERAQFPRRLALIQIPVTFKWQQGHSTSDWLAINLEVSTTPSVSLIC